MRLTLRIWILIIILGLSVLAIKPSFEKGALITSVEPGSIALSQGISEGEIVKEINGVTIESAEEYTREISKVIFGQDPTRLTLKTKENLYILFTNTSPELTVRDVPHTRLQTGLDIQGGARALVKPDVEITQSELQDLIAISSNRFNVFGISDVKITGVSDLSGNKFMLIEVAGATPQDLEELISKQGKFEAKIGNTTVFEGGNKDVTSVCRNDATCAGITACSPSGTAYACNFAFTIYLSEDAAKRHAQITSQIPLDAQLGGQYLAENLTLLIDGSIVDQLFISKDLKGRETTQISIQGSGQGETQEQALQDAKDSMNTLQTVLITGSLPYKLSIVKLDTISPALGDDFSSTILLAGAGSILVVSSIVFIRYRKIGLSAALLATSFSEIAIILGVASLIGWNLDLASIAGILATIGTGVDQQIVIMDENRKGSTGSVKERMARAFFVIMSAYLTALASLLPLYWAGAGLFKGFAITSIIGITAGVFITRPAFADMIKNSKE